MKLLRELQASPIRKTVKGRLKEFASFKDRSSREWFSEMCFCILTANSRAHSALRIQNELGVAGFCECAAGDVRKCIVKYKHRFHNNKTKYIIEARKYRDIKKRLQGLVRESGEQGAREWLVKNIKGLGYKEASHFLRNVGYNNLAILDRHILNVLDENGVIEKPKTLSMKKYLEIEDKFRKTADRLGMSMAELDLYMWYMKTGEVLK